VLASQNGARGNCPFGKAVSHVIRKLWDLVGDDLVAWGLVFAPLVLIYGGAAAWTCLRCRRR